MFYGRAMAITGSKTREHARHSATADGVALPRAASGGRGQFSQTASRAWRSPWEQCPRSNNSNLNCWIFAGRTRNGERTSSATTDPQCLPRADSVSVFAPGVTGEAGAQQTHELQHPTGAAPHEPPSADCCAGVGVASEFVAEQQPSGSTAGMLAQQPPLSIFVVAQQLSPALSTAPASQAELAVSQSPSLTQTVPPPSSTQHQPARTCSAAGHARTRVIQIRSIIALESIRRSYRPIQSLAPKHYVRSHQVFHPISYHEGRIFSAQSPWPERIARGAPLHFLAGSQT